MIDYNDIKRLKEKLGIPEETIEKDYLIELLLNYISLNNRFKRYLVFRGGTALKKIYFPEFRYSEDLDFVVKPGRNLNLFGQSLKEVISKINEELPVELNLKQILYPQRRYVQLFLSYNIVTEIKTVKELKVDIIEDNAVLKSKVRKIVFTYKDFINLSRSLNTYDLESITAEKMVRILDVVDEPRDLWDLLQLLNSKIKPKLISKAFIEKTGCNLDVGLLINSIKKPNYQRTWEIRLTNQISQLPEFGIVVSELELLIRRFFH